MTSMSALRTTLTATSCFFRGSLYASSSMQRAYLRIAGSDQDTHRHGIRQGHTQHPNARVVHGEADDPGGECRSDARREERMRSVNVAERTGIAVQQQQQDDDGDGDGPRPRRSEEADVRLELAREDVHSAGSPAGE